MRPPSVSNVFGSLLRSLELRMLALAVLPVIVLSIFPPYFLTVWNLDDILDQAVVLGIVFVVMTLVILTGGIDLSVGAMAGFYGIVLALLLKEMPIPFAILLAVLCDAGMGLFSGVLVAVFGFASFVVALSVTALARSLAYIVSGQSSISGLPQGLWNSFICPFSASR